MIGVATQRVVDIGARIGVHTGMVMGGIIGTVRFHFDMWGNGVIGAMKMEEMGKKNKVNVSDVTAALLSEDWCDLPATRTFPLRYVT